MSVKGIKRYRKGGRWYCYHRKTGTRITAELGTSAFFAELARLDAELEAAPKPLAGTLGQAIALYRAAPAFLDLMPRTRADYQKVLDFLATPLPNAPAAWTERPLATINPASVARLRDRTYQLKKRRFANYVVSVLGSVFAFAKEYGLMETNPAKGVKPIKRPKHLAKANRPWSEAERMVVFQTAPKQLRVPIALGMATGLRESDVLKVTRDAFEHEPVELADGRVVDTWLVLVTGKAATEIVLPITGWLQRLVDDMPRGDASRFLCVNSKGRPWASADSFRSAFFTHVKALERNGAVGRGLTFHGLRHTVGAALKEAGLSDDEIQLVLGHKTAAMARHYAEGADRRRRMRRIGHVVARFGVADPDQLALQMEGDRHGGAGGAAVDTRRKKPMISVGGRQSPGGQGPDTP